MAKITSYANYTGDLAATDYVYLDRSGESPGARDFKYQLYRRQKQHDNLDALAEATLSAGLVWSSDGSTIGILGILTATGTLDFGSIAAAASADLTITVTGAAVGDAVFIGLPSAPAAGIVFFGFVSASNTVTIRAMNITGSGVDPASATYRATVIKAS